MVSEVESINLQSTPLQYIDLSIMPVAQKVPLKKKLKTDHGNMRTRIEYLGRHCERALGNEFPSLVKDHIILQRAFSSDKDQNSTSRKRKSAELSKQQKEAGNISYNDESFIIESEAVSAMTVAFKGDSPESLEDQNERGFKMDVTRIKQCGTILMTIMNHQFGWVFNQPVDPVKLNIPDYFSIIKYPMDLGTVKDKLERKRYSSTHQFAADVRLTFSNAMAYNPPLNSVHMMAKDLNNIFNTRWKSLESKWRKECPISSQQSVRKITKKQSITSKQVLQRAPSCNSSSLSSKSLTMAEKLKLQNSLAKISRRNIPPALLKFLQKAGLFEQSEEKINLDIDELDEVTLWELHLIVRSCGDAGPLKPAGLMRKSKGLMKECSKGTCGARITSCCVTSGASRTPSACMDSNHSCLNTGCLCICHNGFTQASFSDVDSERTAGRQNRGCHSIASNMDGDNIISGVHEDNGSADTDGRIGTAIADVENAHRTSDPSNLATGSPLKEVEFSCEEQLSPARALRAAMLKSRFADTILKAQHKTLLNHAEKSDPATMQRERKKLEKELQEKKARIEAQVKAAEAAMAMQMKAEADRKMQREREREAARLALEKMEKTVDIDENNEIFKDLENMGYSQPVHLDLPYEINAIEQQSALANPLAQLGLFLKEDDVDEEVDNWISSTADSDREEGEISLS